MFSIIHIYFLMTLIVASLPEKCIPFFDFQKIDDDIIVPGQVQRFNMVTGKFTKFEYMRPNYTGFCSIDYETNLEGKIIRVGVDNLPPYVVYSKDKKISGLFGEVWTTLEKTLKFKSVYHVYRDFSILETGKLDIMLSPTPVDSSSIYYTFSTVIYRNAYSLFMLSDGVSVPKWWYLQIFDEKIWLLLIIFIGILTISMICIDNVEKQLYNCLLSNDDFSCPTYSLLCILGATTGRGIQSMPQTWSLRLCALSALHLGMLISCGFNSTLTSYLALRSHHVKMNSLDDVWNYGTHSVCIRNHSFAHRQLKSSITNEYSEESKKKKMRLLNKNCPNMENESEVKKHLCKPGFIYVESYDKFLKTYQQSHHECQIVKIPGYYWATKNGYLHHAGSKYRKIINTYLIRLQSSGILKYLEDKWTYANRLQKTYKEFQPVQLDHVQVLVSGLFIMMFISSIVCVFENLWFHLYDKKRVISYPDPKYERMLQRQKFPYQNLTLISHI